MTDVNHVTAQLGSCWIALVISGKIIRCKMVYNCGLNIDTLCYR